MAYRCDVCGYRSGKWMGFCPQCGDGSGLAEVADEPRRRTTVATPRPEPMGEVRTTAEDRIAIGIGEVDRVLGGGLVPGGVLLLGGEPGVGKSSLVLQMAGGLVAGGGSVLIATAEESAAQVALRADRLGVADEGVRLLAHDDIDAILAAAGDDPPDLLVIDSIQTVRTADAGSTAGAVSQVRESSARAIRFAKDRGVATVLIGHVTKEGGIAGPRLLEHMVDVVLYLEGESDRGIRSLFALKNRFGATHVAGLFEMRPDGLAEVPDPSAALVAGWQGTSPGSVAFPTVQGRRVFLVEVQALVAPSNAPQPRRSVRGVEAARLHQLLAVMHRHLGLPTTDKEVYVTVTGGVAVREPEVDLPIIAAVASSLLDRPLGSVATWGETGLTGEIRLPGHGDRRRVEAERLGLRTVAPEPGESLGGVLGRLGLRR
ncbi:MAG: DNA repair protein RadA [Acidimicrobiia bacterium]|jgi:DNA repair protein RadA/Sms|nr:MAG: DNA repair protein RadA [Acidimicrobiia bacterium]